MENVSRFVFLLVQMSMPFVIQMVNVNANVILKKEVMENANQRINATVMLEQKLVFKTSVFVRLVTKEKVTMEFANLFVDAKDLMNNCQAPALYQAMNAHVNKDGRKILLESVLFLFATVDLIKDVLRQMYVSVFQVINGLIMSANQNVILFAATMKFALHQIPVPVNQAMKKMMEFVYQSAIAKVLTKYVLNLDSVSVKMDTREELMESVNLIVQIVMVWEKCVLPLDNVNALMDTIGVKKLDNVNHSVTVEQISL